MAGARPGVVVTGAAGDPGRDLVRGGVFAVVAQAARESRLLAWINAAGVFNATAVTDAEETEGTASLRST